MGNGQPQHNRGQSNPVHAGPSNILNMSINEQQFKGALANGIATTSS